MKKTVSILMSIMVAMAFATYTMTTPMQVSAASIPNPLYAFSNGVDWMDSEDSEEMEDPDEEGADQENGIEGLFCQFHDQSDRGRQGSDRPGASHLRYDRGAAFLSCTGAGHGFLPGSGSVPFKHRSGNPL